MGDNRVNQLDLISIDMPNGITYTGRRGNFEDENQSAESEKIERENQRITLYDYITDSTERYIGKEGLANRKGDYNEQSSEKIRIPVGMFEITGAVVNFLGRA